MRTVLRVATTTLTTVALLTTASGTASADPLGLTWIACGEGQTTTGELTINSAHPNGVLDVSGHVTPCRTPTARDVYTIAAYKQGSASVVTTEAVGDNDVRRWYVRYVDGHSFADRVTVDAETRAICLVTGGDARAQCYEVTAITDQTSTPTIGGSIPADDPRVRHYVPCPQRDVSPSCGTCW